MKCLRVPCTGEMVDGYCDVCGMAPEGGTAAASVVAAAAPAGDQTVGSATTQVRRATTTRATGSARSQLGVGLVEVPPVPYRDPTSAIMPEPTVAENRRFCAVCLEPVGRSREGAPGRGEGFCRKCGTAFSFTPKLVAGDVVAGQYEVVGCLAHGGMGWIYLARDHNVADRWVVLKGLLNAGDDDAMAAALAERRFLAEVEHPNIVKIFNFVQHGHDGYIVMEYIGGRSLKELRVSSGENGESPGPLPPAQAMAYMLAILPALGHLHRSGLVFCDFKPDNVIRTQDSLKLIDLGGVYRMSEAAGAVFGTAGYKAPEIAALGPSVPSDLYTVARTLMVLCVELKGYQTTFQYTLPPQDTVELLTEIDSLYRFLEKATAPNPDDRFQTADEMADQLLGVLSETVARREGPGAPRASTLFSGDFRARPDRPDWRRLPVLRVDGDDPASGYLATLAAADAGDIVELLQGAPQRTVEVDLRLARELIDAERIDEADEVLEAIRDADRWEWRAMWLQGVAELARERPERAATCLMEVYRAVPGELAPKLALGVCNEYQGEYAAARRWYDIVCTTDRSYTTATFGLARCCLAGGDRIGALSAYDCVEETSSTYTDARVAAIHVLAGSDDGHDPEVNDLIAADTILSDLDVEAEQRSRLTMLLLQSALDCDLESPSTPELRLAGRALHARDLRAGLEQTYRDLARLAPDASARFALVDAANYVRPRTWT